MLYTHGLQVNSTLLEKKIARITVPAITGGGRGRGWIPKSGSIMHSLAESAGNALY